MVTAPPSWDEIESSDQYQDLDEFGRQQAHNKWENLNNQYTESLDTNGEKASVLPQEPEEVEEIKKPPSWKEIESSPQYQGMNAINKRAAFTKWDTYSRDFANTNGLFDNQEFKTGYEKNANDVLNKINKDSTWTEWYQQSAMNNLKAFENTSSYKVSSSIRDAFESSWVQGDIANELRKKNPSLDYIAQQQKIVDSKPSTDDFQKFMSDDTSGGDSMKLLAQNPIGILGQLLAGSMGSQIRVMKEPEILSKIAERTMQGGMIGGTAGLAGGPLSPITATAGFAGGMKTGFNVGTAEANMMTSHALEYAGTFVESLQKAGIDVSDPEQLKMAFSDTDKINKIRELAQKKAVPIAIVDGFSSVIANVMSGVPIVGPAAAKVTKTLGKKAMQWAGEVAVQSVAGGIGEVAGQVSAYGKVTSPKSVMAEMIAEPVSSLVTEIGPGKASEAVSKLSSANQAAVAVARDTTDKLRTTGSPLTANAVANTTADNIVENSTKEDQDVIHDLIDEDKESQGVFDEEEKVITPTTPNVSTVETVKATENLETLAPATAAVVKDQQTSKVSEPVVAQEPQPVSAVTTPTEAVTEKPAEEAVTKPTPTTPTVFSQGDTVTLTDGRPGTVHAVHDDGTIVVRHETGVAGKTAFKSYKPSEQQNINLKSLGAAPAPTVTTPEAPAVEGVTPEAPAPTPTYEAPTTTPATPETTTAAPEAPAGPTTAPEAAPVEGAPTAEAAPDNLPELEQKATEAQAALDAIGPEPAKPPNEKKAFGTKGRAEADPDVVAQYDRDVKAHAKWKRQYSKLKKAEVDTSNAAFEARKARETAPVQPATPPAPEVGTTSVPPPRVAATQQTVEGFQKLPANQQNKALKAVTVDESPEPYKGDVDLGKHRTLTPEENANKIGDLTRIGALNDDATATSVMEGISKDKKSEPWMKWISKRILQIGLTNLAIDVVYRPDSQWSALYVSDTKGTRILVNTAAHSSSVTTDILHEAVHHITQSQIAGIIKLNDTQQKALDNLKTIFDKVKDRPEFEGEYGVVSFVEFVAEMFSSSSFRDKLHNVTIEGEPVSVWNRAINAVSRMLFGRNVVAGSILEEATANAINFAGDPVTQVSAHDPNVNSSAVVESAIWQDTLANHEAPEIAKTRALLNMAEENTPAPIALPKIQEGREITPEQSKLITDNLSLAGFMAKKFGNIPGSSYDERNSEAQMALINAAQNFDPSKGTPFSAYAATGIRMALKNMYKKHVVRGEREVSTNVPIGEGEEGGATLQDIQQYEEETPKPDQGAVDIINGIKASLSPRDKKIIEDFSSGMVLRDIGQANNISHEGANKIIKRVGAQIRAALADSGITDISDIITPPEQRTQAVATAPVRPADESVVEPEAVGTLEEADIKKAEMREPSLADVPEPADGFYELDGGNTLLVSPRIQTFHGTPHTIIGRIMTKFIGTGEGITGYGWGIYSAMAKGVAEEYKNMTEGVQGNLYTLDLDVEDHELLNWDKQFRDQPDKVKKILEDAGTDNIKGGISGQTLYELLASKHGSQQAASEYLKSLGIPGLRFMDQFTINRMAGNADIAHIERSIKNAQEEREEWKQNTSNDEEIKKRFINRLDRDIKTWKSIIAAQKKFKHTYNYVIFDDTKINITHKNGEHVGTAGELDGTAPVALPRRQGEPETKEKWFSDTAWFKKATTSAWKQSGKLFSAAGRWTPETYDMLRKSGYKTKAAMKRAENLQNNLKSAVKTLAKDGINVSSEVMNKVIAPISNTYTSEQMEAIREITRQGNKKLRDTSLSAAEIKQIEIDNETELSGFKRTARQENIDQGKADAQDALLSLPPDIQEILTEMVEARKELSKRMIAEGNLSDNLQFTIDQNMDIYHHRSYSIFDKDSVRKDFILSDDPEGVRIRNAAEALFKKAVRKNLAIQYAKDHNLKNPDNKITRAAALASLDDEEVDHEARNMLEDYLRVADDSATSLLRGKVPGQKNQSILTLRGDIPAEIRELWGENKEASVNFAKTYTMMSSFLANNEFLNGVLNDGLDKGYLWKKGVSPGLQPNGFVKLFGEDAKSMGPLDGTYGLPEVKDAFEGMDQKRQMEQFASLAWYTMMAMKFKTAYSIQSTVRNYVGNVAFLVANGHYQAALLFLNRKGHIAFADHPFANKITGMTLKERQGYVVHLIEIGVIDDNVGPELLKSLDEFAKSPDFLERISEGTREKFSKFDKTVTNIYGSVDNFWKIVAFEGELSRLKKAIPGGNIDTLEQRAANIIRKTLPTYSEAYKSVRQFFSGPLGAVIAPFITFTSEIVRVSHGTLDQVYTELKDPNLAIKWIGAKRAIGVVAAVGMMTAFPAMVRRLLGYDDDDEEAIRAALPEWQKNATLLFLPRDAAGNPMYLDVSYLNPYNYFSDAVSALLGSLHKGDRAIDVAWAGIKQLIDPVLSEQLFVGALIDIRRNSSSGREVYSEKDNIEVKALKSLAHFMMKAGLPGFVTSAINIGMGATGVTFRGRERNVTDELTSTFLGQRIETVNAEKNLERQLSKFARDRQQSAQLFTTHYGGKESLFGQDVSNAYARANSAEMKDIQNLKNMIEGAEHLLREKPNINAKARVNQMIKESSVGKESVAQARSGVYNKYKPGKELLQRGQRIDPKRFIEFQEAFRNTPARVKLN